MSSTAFQHGKHLLQIQHAFLGKKCLSIHTAIANALISSNASLTLSPSHLVPLQFHLHLSQKELFLSNVAHLLETASVFLSFGALR